jgi:bisphosphoglycerate-independent phosphoglycerate mutase (AlkP superfamily)
MWGHETLGAGRVFAKQALRIDFVTDNAHYDKAEFKLIGVGWIKVCKSNRSKQHLLYRDWRWNIRNGLRGR